MRRPLNALAAWCSSAWTRVPGWFLALYRRPVVFLGVLLAIPLVAVCVWLAIANEQQWRRHEVEHLATTARLASRIIIDELIRTYQIERAVGERADFRAAVRQRDAPALQTFLQTLSDVTPLIGRVFVTDPDGRLLASLPPGPAPAAPLLTSADAPSVSGVYLAHPDVGDKAVLVSYPLHGEGALHMQYRLEEIERWIEKVRVEPAGFVYVTDANGYLVAYPFQVLPGRPKNVSGWPPVAATVTGLGSSLRFVSGRPARRWTAAIAPMEPFGWRVIAQQPDAEMLKPFYELVGSFVVMSLLLLFVVGLPALRWTQLHRTTLQLLEQQARLLRAEQQRRLSETLRPRRDPPQKGAGP